MQFLARIAAFAVAIVTTAVLLSFGMLVFAAALAFFALLALILWVQLKLAGAHAPSTTLKKTKNIHVIEVDYEEIPPAPPEK